jgi:hypothetical protein
MGEAIQTAEKSKQTQNDKRKKVINMKKLLLISWLLATASSSVIAQDAPLPKHYLQPGAIYADTKEHMEQAVSMSTEGDTQAMTEMAMQGELSLPTTKPKEVFVTSGAGDLLFSGYLEFRFKGQTHRYWTLREWISS